MDRTINVYLYGKRAGILSETSQGYVFRYDADYRGIPLSLSMPVSGRVFHSVNLHPFFKGLAPEGWLKKRYVELQGIEDKDIFGMLMHNGNDLLGAVTLQGGFYEST